MIAPRSSESTPSAGPGTVHGPGGTLQAELASGMEEIYAEVEREVSGASPRCDRSGACCMFGEYGHRLYATRAEALLFASRHGAPQGPVGEETCPYQRDNLCTAREGRPLSCRVFYCDPGWKGRGEDLTERMLRRIGVLSERLGIERGYRPFLEHLRAMRADSGGGAGSWQS